MVRDHLCLSRTCRLTSARYLCPPTRNQDDDDDDGDAGRGGAAASGGKRLGPPRDRDRDRLPRGPPANGPKVADPCRVFVTSLTWDTDEADLQRHFSVIGPVASTTVLSSRKGRR